MHTIVVDLGYGDAGKGTVVDWLTSPAMGGEPVGAVVRFNGGAQAGHNVVMPDGRHHTFAQFGSGTLHGVPTHLSRFMLVEPLALAGEARHLAALGVPDPLALLTIDRRALVTTPYHAAANRARETARGSARHGSCGVGIGETMAFALAHPDDALRVGDCASAAALRRKLRRLREHYLDQFGALPGPPRAPARGALAGVYRAFAERVRLVDETYLPSLLGRRRVVFEGAQGVLLDEWRGFHPYTTWSTTTFDNAEALLAEAGQAGLAQRLGVTRPYLTRHGAGPFVTEDAALAAALTEPHNGTGAWQGPFRVGHLDLVALRYAVEVAGGVDALALTHLDRIGRLPAPRVCASYQIGGTALTRLQPGEFADLDHQRWLTALLFRACPVLVPPAADWPEAIAAGLGAPVVLESRGPTFADKQDRIRTGSSAPTQPLRPASRRP